MTASSEYTEYVLEFLQPLLPISIKRLFGGAGLYADGIMFAMIMHNTLYFAVNADTRKKYDQVGMQPFSYMTKNGLIQVRKFYELPEQVLNDPEQLQLWVNEAIHVAYNTKKSNQKTK